MAGVITTGAHPKLLWPGVKTVWGYTYDEWKEQWSDLVDTVTSDKNYEEYVQVAGFGLPQIKSQGQSIVYDTEEQGTVTRLTNVTYALGYMVTMEELQDDLYVEISSRRAMANARSMRLGKEYVVANLYNRAFNNTYAGGDGVSLCNASHPLVFGGTQANIPTVSVDLSEASIEDSVISIMGLLDDRGLPAHIMPESLHVARNEYFNAHRILDSDYQNDTGNNAVNVIKQQTIFPKGIKMNIYFSSARPWFIRTDIAKGEGLVYQERMKVSFDKDNDYDTKNLKAGSVERYTVGWADYRSIWGVNAP
jgi:hypothetical protein